LKLKTEIAITAKNRSTLTFMLKLLENHVIKLVIC